MRRRWRLRPSSAEAESRLGEALGIPPLLARLLASRGIEDPSAASTFLAAELSGDGLRSPALFRQMPAAAGRVVRALTGGERIGIYGDYDVDGISGSALLLRFLRDVGHDPALFLPNRFRDGYGLGENGIRQLAEAGVRLMITVDCGAVAHREIAFAASLGIDTIVCDHHQVAATPLPAFAVLNPIEEDAGFPFRGLCGAGVAFYLALGVRQQLRELGHQPLPNLKRSLDLVALGTIADVVPLLEENRVIVKHGLREILQSGAPGIAALKKVAGVTDVSSATVGFRLAPRLNAAGRLSDASRAVELLTTQDVDSADRIARELDEENNARRRIEAEILDDALRQLERDEGLEQRRSIVLASSDWHPGVIGIVASRLVERYYRPTVVIAVDSATQVGRGSGRSIAGINIHAAFQHAAPHLLGFGGHHMAAGLSVEAERLPELAAAIEEAVRAQAKADDFVPLTWVDAEIPLADLDTGLMEQLDQLQPFGAANPEPVFLVRGVTVAARRVVGEQHAKLFLRQGNAAIGAIGFGLADAPIEVGAQIDILACAERNTWNGRTTLELRLRDWRPAKSS